MRCQITAMSECRDLLVDFHGPIRSLTMNGAVLVALPAQTVRC